MAPARGDEAPAPARRAGRADRLLSSEHLTGWLFVSPAVLIIGLFGVVPIIWSVVLSFQSSDFVTTPTWIGLANYQALLKDPAFAASVRRTIIYTLIFVPVVTVASLAVAVALNRAVRGMRFYRTAVFAPVVTSTVATAIIFNWLLDPYFGILNAILVKLGIPAQQFFQDPSQALYCIVVMTVWGWLGFAVIIYLAALQGVPQELMEAAAIDGATRWRAFRRVQLPLLGPSTLFLVIWLSINALQLFDEIYVTTRGGPLGSTTVVVYYLYQQAFQLFNAGYATAIAYVLFLGILVLTVVQLVIGRRFVHYRS
ncbi:MAG TPA: sugar ABC transporter permease [Thermoleophilia bacterium]|nr:sugar ABC transporter permease [Thermoleophilia bacterium]